MQELDTIRGYNKGLNGKKTIDKDIIEVKKKELLKDLNGDYAGYTEYFGNNFPKIIEHFKKYGIKVTNLKLLMKIRGKMTGLKKFYGLGVGDLVWVADRENMESTVNHETVHTMQYRENSPISFLSKSLKARLGFISFGIMQQWKEINKLKKERKKYGTRAAAQYSTKNTAIEFETFLHEGDTTYLERRKPFAYRQYETKAGRSVAMIKEMDTDILKRIQKVTTLLTLIETKQDSSQEDIAAINSAIEQITEETKKIEEIKEKYGTDDRELIGTMESTKGVLRWAEPKKLVEKRLLLLEKFLEKEHTCVKELRKYGNAKLLSSQEDMDENGVIRIKAKDKNTQKLLKEITADPVIQKLNPNITIQKKSPETSGEQYIRISFTTE